MSSDLSVRGVAKQWADGPVLADVDLDVAAGEIVAVLGRSGSGKSTLLRIIAGLEVADAGRVSIGGLDVTALRPADRDVGMVFQHSPLLPHLTVGQNIGFGISRRRRLDGGTADRVGAAAELVGCAHLLDRPPSTLSGGERQRAALARALVRSPKLVLLDEPLSSLDIHDRVELRTALRAALVKSGSTGVHVTHDQSEAFAVGDRIAVIDEGVVQQIGTADDLYDRPASVAVARLVGSPRINLLTSMNGLAGPFRLSSDGADIADGITIGVRPSDLEIVSVDSTASPDVVVAIVESVEIADDRAVVHVAVDGEADGVEDGEAQGEAQGVTQGEAQGEKGRLELIVTTTRQQRPAVGQRIGLAGELRRYLVFDSDGMC